MTKRSVFLAGFFNFISPGLGFLYTGKLLYAIGFPLLIILMAAASSWTKIIFNPTGFVILLILFFVLMISGVISACVIAHRSADIELAKFQKWYIYLIFFIISQIVGELYRVNRATLLGIETFRYPSRSMKETILPGDYIVSDTWKFKTTSPKRGELIIFRFPPDPSLKYLKRVIGLPGDLIEISNGNVIINGTKLHEDYIDEKNNNQQSYQNPGSYQVPEGHYFVLGDNRDNSNDSRYWGYVPNENLHGSVEFIYFSLGSTPMGRIERIGMRLK